jgi:predicted dehydrogenase
MRPFLDARDHMLDDGVHAIDTLRWMCGGEVTAVHDVCRRVSTPDINFISALLEFDSGATGVLLCSWTSGRRIFAVEMHAPSVCAEADLEGVGHLFADGSTTPEVFDARDVAGSDALHVYGGFSAKHREFIDCLKAGSLPSSHFGDALRTMEVAEQILARATLKGV